MLELSKSMIKLDSLQNLTTGFPIIKDVSASNQEAVEYDIQHIYFNVASKSCGLGQLVSLSSNIHFNSQVHAFEATGKIVSIKSIAEGQIKIGIELHAFDKKLWKDFFDFQEKQQAELDRLFVSMKGDE